VSEGSEARQFFVTGTDTGVGKTVLSALLCAALNAYYWKPIQTGADEDSDSQTVAELAELGSERIFPEAYRFAPPVSPHLAAQWAGTEIDLAKIQLPEDARGVPLIVEGAGGVMVPVYDRHFMVDVMKQLALPVLLATRSVLGTINHTLLSLAALRRADLEVAGVVIIGAPNSDNRDAIRKYGEVRIVGEIPRLGALDRKSLLNVFTDLFDHEVFAPKAKGATG
jgi:dethiobiotin synthetase